MTGTELDRAGKVTVQDTGITVRQYYVMAGLGAFVTTIAQPGVIGRLSL
jgi:hypothetical protein